jgi:hypothetical protein
MNQQSQLPAKVPVNAGGQVAALIPQNLEEAFRVANAIAMSGLAPKGIDKPEQIMVAIMAGAELGLAPFQSLQSIAVVNGRPTLYGDGLMAVARSQGIKAKEWIDGEGEDMVAHCMVTRPDSGEEIERTFSVYDAKKASLWGKQGPWQQYPRRMLQMRARAWALRDGCADMIRGFQVREEVEDMGVLREVRAPEATGMRARLEARRTTGGFDPEHIEAELEPVETVVETALPPMKTGAQLLAEQEAAGAAQTDSGPETAAEVENAAQNADFEPAGQSDDTFPGDRPANSPEGGSGANNPGADAQDGYGADAIDPMEFKAEAERVVELCSRLADLKALNKQYADDGSFDRLKAASRTDYDDLIATFRDKDAELKKAEATRG